MKNTTEITVPLNCLTVSDMNVRRTPADGSTDAELKASLAAHGLFQNLVVHRNESIEGYYDLADRKLAAIADGLRESWKCVKFELEFGWDEEGKLNKVYPVKGELTPDEDAEMDDPKEGAGARLALILYAILTPKRPPRASLI